MACAYCYEPRHKGYGNPVTVFANIDQIAGALERHVIRQGIKLEPNQCDPELWVYDIGENSDCSASVTALFFRIPGGGPSCVRLRIAGTAHAVRPLRCRRPKETAPMSENASLQSADESRPAVRWGVLGTGSSHACKR